jgi:hypothetical protein
MHFSVSFSHVLLPLFVCFVYVFFVRGGRLVAHFCDAKLTAAGALYPRRRVVPRKDNRIDTTKSGSQVPLLQ